MTQYSSGKHDRLTADPTPYVHSGPMGYESRTDYRECLVCFTSFKPRPEFDRPLTNPANPILAGIREKRFTRREALDAFGDGFDQFAYPFSGAEVTHATRILQRLANLTTGTESTNDD